LPADANRFSYLTASMFRLHCFPLCHCDAVRWW